MAHNTFDKIGQINLFKLFSSIVLSGIFIFILMISGSIGCDNENGGFGPDAVDVNGDGFIDENDDLNGDGVIDGLDEEIFSSEGPVVDPVDVPPIPDTSPRVNLPTGQSTTPVSLGSEGSNNADSDSFGAGGDVIVCAVENVGGGSTSVVANLTDNTTLNTFPFDFGNSCGFIETTDGTDCVVLHGGIVGDPGDGLIIGCDDGSGAPTDITSSMPNAQLVDIFSPQDPAIPLCVVDSSNNEVTCFNHTSAGSGGFVPDPANSFDASFFNSCSSGNNVVSVEEDNDGNFIFLMSNGELVLGQPGDAGCTTGVTIPTNSGIPFDMNCADNPNGTNSGVCGVVMNGIATDNFVFFTITASSTAGALPTLSVNASAESVGQSPVRGDAEVILGVPTFIISSFTDDVFHQITTDLNGVVTSHPPAIALSAFCGSGATSFITQDDLDGGTQQALVGCSGGGGGFNIIDLP